jgi:hypothetical protein
LTTLAPAATGEELSAAAQNERDAAIAATAKQERSMGVIPGMSIEGSYYAKDARYC